MPLYSTSASSLISCYLLFVLSLLQFGSWLCHLADLYVLRVSEFRSQLLFILDLSTKYGDVFKALDRSGRSLVTTNMELRSYVSHPYRL